MLPTHSVRLSLFDMVLEREYLADAFKRFLVCLLMQQSQQLLLHTCLGP